MYGTQFYLVNYLSTLLLIYSYILSALMTLSSYTFDVNEVVDDNYKNI